MKNIAKKHDSIIKILAFSVEKDEEGIRNILKRNGINTALIKSKRELTTTFLKALSKSKVLALDFGNYVKAKVNSMSNAAGRDPVEGLNIENLTQGSTYDYNVITTTGLPTGSNLDSSASNTLNNTGGGFFQGINLADLLNTGVKALELQKDIQVSKDNRAAIEEAVQIKRDEINLKPDSPKSQTALYVALGVIGLILTGGIIYFATKNK